MFTPQQLLANLLFAETKDIEDAEHIASVVLNRLKRPERFGSTLEEVIFAPNQFAGVNSAEWRKAITLNFTPEEEEIYKQFLRIAHLALTGRLEDKTNGADHYVNLKISKPAWAKIYKKTAETKFHTYFKEIIPKKGRGKNKPNTEG